MHLVDNIHILNNGNRASIKKKVCWYARTQLLWCLLSWKKVCPIRSSGFFFVGPPHSLKVFWLWVVARHFCLAFLAICECETGGLEFCCAFFTVHVNVRMVCSCRSTCTSQHLYWLWQWWNPVLLRYIKGNSSQKWSTLVQISRIYCEKFISSSKC